MRRAEDGKAVGKDGVARADKDTAEAAEAHRVT
jgi:hypothetical protein